MSRLTPQTFEEWERSYPFPPVPDTGITGAIVRDVLRAAYAAGAAAGTERAASLLEAAAETKLYKGYGGGDLLREFAAAIRDPGGPTA